MVILLSAFLFASLDILNKVFVGKESFWAMIFYTALFTTLICAYPASLAWVAPTPLQYGLLAVLGGGANGLLFCLLKSFSMVDASALAPFRYTELILSASVGEWLWHQRNEAGYEIFMCTRTFVVCNLRTSVQMFESDPPGSPAHPLVHN